MSLDNSFISHVIVSRTHILHVYIIPQYFDSDHLVRSSFSALESGTSSTFFGALSCPLGMGRRNVSYDELIDAPMNSPPSDLSVNILWKDPVIPKHRFRNTAEVLHSDGIQTIFSARS